MSPSTRAPALLAAALAKWITAQSRVVLSTACVLSVLVSCIKLLLLGQLRSCSALPVNCLQVGRLERQVRLKYHNA